MANSSSYAVGLDGDVSGFINALDKAISKYKTLDKTIKENENVSSKSKKVIVDNNSAQVKSGKELADSYKVNATNMSNQDTNLKNTINSNTRAILGDNNSKLGSNDKLKINFSDSTK